LLILESNLLNKFPGIVFGFSTKVGPGEHPYYFNLSLSVGDDKERVLLNRQNFFSSLGLNKTAYQKQVHGNEIKYVEKEGYAGESDAMITDRPGLGLIISAADCTSIYIYDFKKNIIAGVHAGWRGTQKNILEKTIDKLVTEYACSVETMAAYIAPSIASNVYEVDRDVAVQFDEKYYTPSGSKYLLNVSGKNYDALLSAGIPSQQIQYSTLCTFQNKSLFHSYRRDGVTSGRSIGVFALRENK
jgi:polyphenol oxidase